jgi:hypothetical protein
MTADQNDLKRQGVDLDTGVTRVPISAPTGERVLPYHHCPVEEFPEPIRGYVVVSAASLHCDVAFVAVPLLVALASAIGNSRRVEIKADWHESPVLWAAVVGRSGTGKSPGLDKALVFVHEQDRIAHKEYRRKREAYETARQEYDREYSRWRRGKTNDPPPSRPNPPPEARHVVNDATIEAVFSLHAESPRGLLLARDEISAWFGSFGLYKNGRSQTDEAQWIESYGGRAVRVDRKDRDRSIYVPRASVSIVGGVQPAVLAKCLTSERIGSGMAARFLLVMPPEAPQLWSDTVVDEHVQESVREVFRHLYGLTGKQETSEDGLTPIDIPLSPEAKEIFVEYHDELRREQPGLDDATNAAWSKFIGLAARLALVLHLVKDAISPSWPPNQPISEATMREALVITRWAQRESRRVYALLHEDAATRRLRLALELARRQQGQTTPRAHTADDAKASIDQLVAAGHGQWLRTATEPQGGRPSDVFVLGAGHDKTDETPSAGGSVGFVSEGGADTEQAP